MQETSNENKPLIIYLDDNGEEKKTYSYYKVTDNIISFVTQSNKITIPIHRLIKIKEGKND